MKPTCESAHPAPWIAPAARDQGSSRGFTLLELLVVVGLIAALSLVLFIGLRGTERPAALQSAQATIASLVTAARLKAAASGRHVRLLVADDPTDGDRYLRFIVLQQARQPGTGSPTWDTVQTVTLPAGAYVVPAALSPPAGLVSDLSAWRRATEPGEELVSGVFRNQRLTLALEGDSAARTWTGVGFTPQGTLAPLSAGPPSRGLLVIAPGHSRAPGSYGPGESPVQLAEPDAVRGLVLSVYGVPALLSERSAF